MHAGLRGGIVSVSGFFLMEVVVLIMVFISFSTVVVGWYSNFTSIKVDMMRRGQAIFIASNALELIRMQGKIPERIDSIPGFKTTVSVNRYFEQTNFFEVTVTVKFSELLDPVCLTTGMLLHRIIQPLDHDLSSEYDIGPNSESLGLADSMVVIGE